MRALLLADDCNPDWPSLPLVGYNACKAIAGCVNVVVATHVRNREAIQRQGLGKAEVVYVDTEYLARPLVKFSSALRGSSGVGWTTALAVYYPAYLAFEWEVWKKLSRQLKSGYFDIVHRVTPMSPTIPSPLALWSPVPFILGPLNGGLKWPAAFESERVREKEWLTYVRRFHSILPYYRETYTRAKAVLAAFSHTVKDVPRVSHNRTINFPEVGIDPALFFQPAARQSGDQLTFLFVGRLVPYKCADIVIESFSRSEILRRHRLQIVGDGPERSRLERMISDYGLGACVELLGRQPQQRVAELMRRSHVFAFPSIRELGAGVVVEAMASGLASVVVDYGGPGGLISSETGVKVPLAHREAIIAGFVQAMETLAANPSLVARLGSAARNEAIEHYSWEKKAQRLVEVYRWVLDREKTKPRFKDCS